LGFDWVGLVPNTSFRNPLINGVIKEKACIDRCVG
jgi:hypothetical protein